MTNANTTAAPAARQAPAALAFEGVSFAYPAPEGASDAAARPVLDGCSLRVPDGAFCLLVGDTGSGKTTLLRLAKPEIAPAGRLDGLDELGSAAFKQPTLRTPDTTVDLQLFI